jgi:FkbM family methyltransferase
MNMKTVAKSLALRLIPETALHFIKKIHYARVLRSISETDEPDLRVLKHFVSPGHHVADLGANIGIYTKCLSELVGTSGRVHSVEPIPLTFDILRSNVRKFRLRNVELKNCAISDSDGNVTMEVPRFDGGGENFYGARIVSGHTGRSCRQAVVPSYTVDSLFSELESPIHFIKCDVEGHELSCLRGAVRTIQSSKPAWLIEISSRPDDEKSTSYQTFRLLRESQYQAYWFDGSRLRVYRAGDTSVNYFFLRAEHLRVLRERDFPVQG